MSLYKEIGTERETPAGHAQIEDPTRTQQEGSHPQDRERHLKRKLNWPPPGLWHGSLQSGHAASVALAE